MMTEKERIEKLDELFEKAQENTSKLETHLGSYSFGYFNALLDVRDWLRLEKKE